MDAFALLSSGIRFNKQKYGKDIQAFKEPEKGLDGGNKLDARHDVFENVGNDSIIALRTKDPNEGANTIRKANKIKVCGSDTPDPLQSWDELATRWGCSKRIMLNLESFGFGEPTPVQRQAIPALLERRDLMAVAPTGSGKTLAFAMPILSALITHKYRHPEDWPNAPKALLLSPSQELARQTERVLGRLVQGTGLRLTRLSRATAAGSDFSHVDVLVANPLRLSCMVTEGSVDLSQVRWLVLDEADKLFEEGFLPQIDALLGATRHPSLVRAALSATLPENVEDALRSVMADPLRVVVGLRNSATSMVKQRLVFAGNESGKLLRLRQMLREGLKPPVLVFVATKERACSLHQELKYEAVHVDVLHAGQSSASRKVALDKFREGTTWVLIATDLISRGMDFARVSTVVSYDFPNSTTDYVHRVGRTGRGGQTGEAITFFTEEDAPALRPVANIIKGAGGEVADWMTHLKRDKRHKHRLPGQVAVNPDEVDGGHKRKMHKARHAKGS